MSQEISISAGRFPWVPEFNSRYGVDKPQWRALTDAVFPNAKSLDSIVLALSYCKARGLDVFKRPVHIVPMWSSAANNGKGAMVDTIWPGIGELRTTAVRTGTFAGRDAAIYGPTVKSKFGDAELEHPEWCEVVVYRMVQNQRVACHGPRAYWRETYATKKRDDPTPNDMWQKRPFGQIEKCAEAGALRAAFPEEIGNEYCADEMDGKVIEGRFEAVTAEVAPSAVAKPAQNKLAAFAAPSPEEEQMLRAARIKAICEALSVARSQRAINQIKRDAIEFMARLDEEWPEGKEQIIAAIQAAEDSPGLNSGGNAAGETRGLGGSPAATLAERA